MPLPFILFLKSHKIMKKLQILRDFPSYIELGGFYKKKKSNELKERYQALILYN